MPLKPTESGSKQDLPSNCNQHNNSNGKLNPIFLVKSGLQKSPLLILFLFSLAKKIILPKHLAQGYS